MHVHTLAGMAVAAQADGLLPLSMPYTNFHRRVAYHEFESAGSNWDERAMIAASLGSLDVMILRNHGLLTCGRTVAEAFVLMFRLEKACQVQLAAQASGAKLKIIRPEILEKTAKEMIHLLDRDEKGNPWSGHRRYGLQGHAPMDGRNRSFLPQLNLSCSAGECRSRYRGSTVIPNLSKIRS